MRIILIVFGISLAIFMSLGTGLHYFSPSYESLSKDFFQNIQKENYVKAYDLFSNKFKKNISFAHFQDFMKHSEYRDYRSAEWQDIQINKNDGYMKGVIFLKSGKKIPLEFYLVKEKGNIDAYLPGENDKKLIESVPNIEKIAESFLVWKIDVIQTSADPKMARR